jgi:AraC-like DNA-binding protein
MKSNLDFLMYHTVPGGTHFDFHSHNCFELVYYVSGKGHMYIEQQSCPYEPGTITLTRPHLYHDERHDEESEILFIGFLYDDTPGLLNNGVYKDNSGVILSQLLQMKKEMQSPRGYHAEQMDLMTAQVVLELLRIGTQPQRKASNNKLRYAIRTLEENYLQSVDLHALATLSGYSFHRFRHLFKEETGLSPLSFVIEKRLGHARQLLTTSDRLISAIAMDCGFSTASQFGSMFKQKYDLSPSEYRLSSYARMSKK